MSKIFIDVFPPKNKSADEEKPTSENLSEIISEDEADIDTDMEISANIPPLPFGQDDGTRPRVEYNLRRFDASDAEKSGGVKIGGFIKGLAWKLPVLAAVLLLAMYGIDSKFAKAEVKIWPHISDFRQELNVSVETSIGDIDLEKRLIPGYLISAENIIAHETPATGENARQAKAKGTVKIFNNYTGTQTLVRDTRLQAPLEKFNPALSGEETPWFRTTEAVSIAPKSSVVVNVVAAGAGEKYNIEPSVFSVPGLVGTAQYTFVYGQSFEKFSGGSDEAVLEATEGDIKNSKTAAEEFAKEQIKNELIDKIAQQGLIIVDQSAIELEVGEPEILAAAGDAVALIESRTKAKAAAVAYKKADLEKLGREFILANAGAGNLVDEKSFSFDHSFVQEEKTSTIKLICRAATYQSMSAEDLKKALSEKSADEAKIFLASQQGVKQTEIKLAPPWRLAVPRSLDRIEIETVLE